MPVQKVDGLKPCPFCGGRKINLIGLSVGLNGTLRNIMIECSECGAGTVKHDSFYEAVDTWNTKPLDRRACNTARLHKLLTDYSRLLYTYSNEEKIIGNDRLSFNLAIMVEHIERAVKEYLGVDAE